MKQLAAAAMGAIPKKLRHRLGAGFVLLGEALQGLRGGSGWNVNAERRAISELQLAENAVIFDVGANRGEWAEMLWSVRPDAFVHMFEPQPALVEILRQRFASVPNAVVHGVGLGDHSGELNLYMYSDDHLASFHAREERRFETPVRTSVPVDTVDSVMQRLGLTGIDLLKIDVEGHELSVMKGCETAFSGRLIRAIQFEFGAPSINSGVMFRQIFDFLSGHSFSLFRIDIDGQLQPITEYRTQYESYSGVANYIAIAT